MALLESLQLPLGAPIIPFSLPGIDGNIYTLESFAAASVVVIVFTCNHCPYAQAAEPFLLDLAKQYQPQGVAFVAINPNDAGAYPEDSFEAMKQRAMEKQYPFPYLRDEDQIVAKAYQAQCTPDIYVYDQTRTLAYHGRINNLRKAGDEATTHELQNALDALLAGRPPITPQKSSMGCSIKWK
jgi:peroxiredoxin